jgi:hypothetical protein
MTTRIPARLFAAFLLVLTGGAAVAQIAFTDVSRTARIDRVGESYGAAWGDLNADGYPDLFASNHRQQPSLWLNRGNGTFFETAPQVLIWRNQPRADTHGGSWADFDGDGDQDLLVSAGTGNLSQFLVNEHQRLVNRTQERGLTTTNLGGRLPVWFDYDGDRLEDFVMTQFGGIAKLYRQGPPGHFVETTAEAKLLCIRFHYGQLLDLNNDGTLDLVCSHEGLWPQKVYDMTPLPWKKIYDSANPAPYLPAVKQGVDSAIADFDNDGRMDLFVLGGSQLRPSGVSQAGATHVEAQLMNGIKGFRFTSSGQVTFQTHWNKQDERTTTDFRRIRIGATGFNPAAATFTLDPTKPNVRGMPPAPTQLSDIPVMNIGFDPATQRWTLVIWTELPEPGPAVFSEAYLLVDSTAPITGLAATGLWPSEKPALPTLLMNRSGGFIDETVRANLVVPVQCISVTPGDFDNDMDVDLYLGCRTGTSNIANQLWENLGGATFRRVRDAGGALGPVGIAVASGAGTADTVAAADFDVDGFLDLFVNNGFNLRPLGVGGPNVLFRNQGNGRRWVEVDLVGRQSERDATGARIYATANGVRQLRVQNGAYHRWSQDHRRAHFGLAGATTVNLRVEWPSGNVQTFDNVATNRVYTVTEGVGIASTRIGGAPAYQCGPTALNAAIDKGLFLWRDCPSGEWRLRTTAGGGAIVHAGTVTSTAAFVSVRGVSLGATDTLSRPDPTRITFRLDTRGKATDGINFTPKDGASVCLSVQTPAGSKVVYGPFRASLAAPLELDTRGGC